MSHGNVQSLAALSFPVNTSWKAISRRHAFTLRCSVRNLPGLYGSETIVWRRRTISFAGGIRFFIQPLLYGRPNEFEWIGPRAPG
jgi:hypothetical protein